MICLREFPRHKADQLSDDFDVLEGTMNLMQAMYLNNAKGPLTMYRVRQALCYAVDPQGIMDMISDGKETQIGSGMFRRSANIIWKS